MCELMDNYVKKSNEIAKAEGKAEGKTEGEYEKAMCIAKNMLKNGISLDMVVKCSDLPQETVLKLQNEMILA